MKSSGLVKERLGNKLVISMYKESACSHCNNCSDSAKIANTFTFITDRDDVNIGDIITFEMEDNQVFKAAMIVYIFPLIFMFLGYFLGSKLGFSEGKNIGMSFMSLVVAFIGIFVYDKKIVKHKIEKSVKIIDIERK
ncbi:MAG: SoxR reducing system RseC family protein [Cetobacterium sp.]|uniref:SoxR reducing system RseC family protein n=1 Tax=Cetobacterium sp. TaxID=2071632 RepID=UPI003EE4F076